MDAKLVPYYLEIQELAASDPRFQEIQSEYQDMDKQLRSVLSAMPEDHWNTIMDYLGIRAALQLRLTELTIEYMLQK